MRKFANATGHFHLERTAAGGENADGFYLLVFEALHRDGRSSVTTLPRFGLRWESDMPIRSLLGTREMWHRTLIKI